MSVIRFTKASSILTLAAAALLSNTASAGIITEYSDKTTFLNATGVSSVSGPIAGGLSGTTLTLGDVTITTNPFALSGGIITNNWSTQLAGNEIAISGAESLEVSINLANAGNSFGFEFHEPSITNQLIDGTNTPFFHDSEYEIKLFNGLTLVDTSTFAPPNDVASFYGVYTNMFFDRVQIIENLSSSTYAGGINNNNDNEFFGQFYAGSVPEPGALSLMVVSLLGLGLSRRRRQLV